MLSGIHSKKGLQLVFGLIAGFLFGVFLQKGGVTQYDVIVGQLLLKDFTVLKIMLTASVTGMIGVHILRALGLAKLHPKPGSIGMTVIGGLLFGLGFAVLGYCPGTVAGAVGNGYLDATIGGVLGILVGAGLFAGFYPKLAKGILSKGNFGDIRFPQLLKLPAGVVVVIFSIVIIGILYLLESAGL